MMSDTMRHRLLYFLIGLVIFLLIALTIWQVPKRQANAYRERFDDSTLAALQPKERVEFETAFITAENNARITLAQSIGGLLLILSLGATWYNIKATQKNSQETIRVTEQGKLTERFGSAIELLGNEKMEIRLGGIYALERIAKDSEEYHWIVMEVLSSFARDKGQKSKEDKHTQTDIQAVLTVIGRRQWIAKEGEGKINLANTSHIKADLRRADFSRADLSKVDFREAKLTRANLSGADLNRADLREADLRAADLSGANLNVADLRGAYLGRGKDKYSGDNLTAANLTGAYLIGAQLIGAQLIGVKLIRAHLTRADLNGANLKEANLEEANLIGANLHSAILNFAEVHRANLTEADLSEANLSGATLRGASLRKANFTGANLSEADLQLANVSGADFTGANLYKANFTGAILSGAHVNGVALADFLRAYNANQE
jgi:uncharacterized protein YjbI with pentapeptide repeats